MGMIMKDGVPYGGVYPIDDVPTQGSDNTVKSGGVFSAIEPLPAIQNILGAKNIFTGWEAESNKILIAISDCAPATSYIFSYGELSTMLQYRLYFVNSSGTITEVTNGWTFISNPLSFTTNSDTVQVTFRVKYANDSAISPSDISSTMIRPAGTDATYASYAKTNKQLTESVGALSNLWDANTEAIAAIVNVNGSCNILPYIVQSTASATVIFTVNNDGTVTVNGTPTSSYPYITYHAGFTLKAGTYVIDSGVPAQSSVYVNLKDSGGNAIANTYGGKKEFTLTSDTVVVAYIYLHGMESVSNFTIYPMLYDARLNPSGYVQHAMTNKELTDAVENVAKTEELIGSGQCSSIGSAEEFTLTKPITNYRLITLVLTFYEGWLGSHTLATEEFRKHAYDYWIRVYGGESYADIKYVNDSKISVEMTNVSTQYWRIYGIV